LLSLLSLLLINQYYHHHCNWCYHHEQNVNVNVGMYIYILLKLWHNTWMCFKKWSKESLETWRTCACHVLVMCLSCACHVLVMCFNGLV
jgi:hypothetical protein